VKSAGCNASDLRNASTALSTFGRSGSIMSNTKGGAPSRSACEGFSTKLTKQRLKRGVLRGIVGLQGVINRYLAETNDYPKPFIWTADPMIPTQSSKKSGGE
jgi:hypothetical protein